MFEIGLSTTGYQAAFGDKAATYLHSLTRQGTVLSGYRSLGSSELADELAAIGGQPPNSDTRGGCMKFAEFKTGVVANAKGLVPGNGCVYPETALTIGDQVTSSGHTWGAYVADQGTKEACIHPNSNAVDNVALPFADPGYEDRHNPFVYFHSLLDLGDCSSDDLDLTKLPADAAIGSEDADVHVRRAGCLRRRAGGRRQRLGHDRDDTHDRDADDRDVDNHREFDDHAGDIDNHAGNVGDHAWDVDIDNDDNHDDEHDLDDVKPGRRASARARHRPRPSAARSDCQPPPRARRDRSGSPPRTRSCRPGCHGSFTRAPIARTACW